MGRGGEGATPEVPRDGVSGRGGAGLLPQTGSRPSPARPTDMGPRDRAHALVSRPAAPSAPGSSPTLALPRRAVPPAQSRPRSLRHRGLSLSPHHSPTPLHSAPHGALPRGTGLPPPAPQVAPPPATTAQPLLA